MHVSLNKASNSKDFKIKESKPNAHKPKALNSNNSSRLDLEGMPKPLTKLRKRRKNIRNRKNKRKTPMLVLISPRPLELLQETILVGRNVSNKTLVRPFAETIIKKINI